MSEWISVKDKMPECFIPVLAIHWLNGELRVVNSLLSVSTKDEWCVGISDNRYSGTVTHWMLLPKPPEPKT